MRWLKALFTLIACAIVFGLATSLTIRFLLTSESAVSCPDIIGLDYEEAKRTADLVGLSVIAVKYEVKKDVPYNKVIVQKPDAGTPVRVGRTVSVILSDGPKPVTIPQFVGLSFEEAQAELEATGMPLKKVIYVPADDIGKVVAQAPSSGENILDEEGMVLIVGGREKRFFVMPEFTAGDMPSVLDELDKKQIKYALVPTGPPETAKGAAPINIVPPKAIFNEGSTIELPMQGNKG
jgi:eukaryotic-like serine/threonine-protein kinase